MHRDTIKSMMTWRLPRKHSMGSSTTHVLAWIALTSAAWLASETTGQMNERDHEQLEVENARLREENAALRAQTAQTKLKSDDTACKTFGGVDFNGYDLKVQPPACATRPSIPIGTKLGGQRMRQRLPNNEEEETIPPPPRLANNGRNVAVSRLVFNESMNQTWWTGVALLNSKDWPEAQILVSLGNWYSPPYPFHVQALSLGSKTPVWETPTVPGAMFPARGVNKMASFAGQNYVSPTHSMTFASFAPDNAKPEWSLTPVGTAGTWWQTTAPIQSSANGSIVAYAVSWLDHYDPLGPKHAEVAVIDTAAFAPRTVLSDKFGNDTGLEGVHLSADSNIMVVIVADVAATGSINQSTVRVYDVAGGTVKGEFTTGYVLASCMSPDGATLVLATCDSENAIEVWLLTDGTPKQLVNSSYPPLVGTFTYAKFCVVTPSGGLWVGFPLWWENAVNATAVAYWSTLPSMPMQGYMPPTSLWQSPGISDTLQDDLQHCAYAGGVFAFTSWGGAPLDPTSDSTPPTLRVFADATPHKPLLEISTPSFDGRVSGSLESLDMAVEASANGSTVRILAEGRNYHANIGSSGGRLYMWEVEVNV